MSQLVTFKHSELPAGSIIGPKHDITLSVEALHAVASLLAAHIPSSLPDHLVAGLTNVTLTVTHLPYHLPPKG